MDESFRILKFGKLFFCFIKTERGLFLNSIGLREGSLSDKEIYLPFTYVQAGKHNGFFGTVSDVYNMDPENFVQTNFEYGSEYMVLAYDSDFANVKCRFDFTGDGYSFTLKACFTSKKQGLVLNSFGLALPLAEYEDDGEAYRLYFRRNKWQAEGQWSQSDLRELGFLKYINHPSLNEFSVYNYGSQTTSSYYPSLMLSKKDGQVWFMEGEAFGNWSAKLCQKGVWGGKISRLFFLYSCFEEREFADKIVLNDREAYESPEVLYVFSESEKNVCEHVYSAKRKKNSNQMNSPVAIFNDYMNCLWARPDYQSEIALIERAAKLGLDYYIIDDGWYLYKGDKEVGNRLGDWNDDGDLLGASGLTFLIEYILSKKMKPGIWMELEVAGKNSRVFQEHPHWFIEHCGVLYGSASRYFFNFSVPQVNEYLFSVIEKYYTMGIRYLKIDYNDSYLWTDECRGSFSLRENYKKICGFYKKIKKTFPDLILENCASGGMRSDNGILKYFDLQSMSDQENYQLIPSLIQGSLVNNVPEKLGIWSMPYPIGFYEKEGDPSTVKAPDDEQIIFNLVNGLAGCLVLSSRIDFLGGRQEGYLTEALRFYRENFSFVKRAYPEYPYGLQRVNNDRYALILRYKKRALLYTWALKEKVFEIGEVNGQNCRQIFPKGQDSLISEGKIELKNKYSARIFEVL